MHVGTSSRPTWCNGDGPEPYVRRTFYGLYVVLSLRYNSADDRHPRVDIPGTSCPSAMKSGSSDGRPCNFPVISPTTNTVLSRPFPRTQLALRVADDTLGCLCAQPCPLVTVRPLPCRPRSPRGAGVAVRGQLPDAGDAGATLDTMLWRDSVGRPPSHMSRDRLPRRDGAWGTAQSASVRGSHGPPSVPHPRAAPLRAAQGRASPSYGRVWRPLGAKHAHSFAAVSLWSPARHARHTPAAAAQGCGDARPGPAHGDASRRSARDGPRVCRCCGYFLPPSTAALFPACQRRARLIASQGALQSGLARGGISPAGRRPPPSTGSDAVCCECIKLAPGHMAHELLSPYCFARVEKGLEKGCTGGPRAGRALHSAHDAARPRSLWPVVFRNSEITGSATACPGRASSPSGQCRRDGGAWAQRATSIAHGE